MKIQKKNLEGGCECFCENSKKKKTGGRCEWRREAFVKIQRKKFGCEQSENKKHFVKIKKN